MDDSTYLYSATTSLETCAIFLLPKTYFVELLSTAENNMYHARYDDVYGYVKKEQVKPVKNIPAEPFLNKISFRVFVPSGANLRTSPYDYGATNLVYSIPFLETNLQYYGTTLGEESISKKGNVWYYCKYYLNNISYSGYIYSPLCDCLSPISTNQEMVEYIQGELAFKNETNVDFATNNMELLPQSTQTIIIILISMPCLFIIYLLFKPTKMLDGSTHESSNKVKKRKKISRLRHSDYFELDDDFN